MLEYQTDQILTQSVDKRVKVGLELGYIGSAAGSCLRKRTLAELAEVKAEGSEQRAGSDSDVGNGGCYAAFTAYRTLSWFDE